MRVQVPKKRLSINIVTLDAFYRKQEKNELFTKNTKYVLVIFSLSRHGFGLGIARPDNINRIYRFSKSQSSLKHDIGRYTI